MNATNTNHDNNRYYMQQSKDFEYIYQTQAPQAVSLNSKTVTDPSKLPHVDEVKEMRNYELQGNSQPNYHQTELLESAARDSKIEREIYD